MRALSLGLLIFLGALLVFAQVAEPTWRVFAREDGPLEWATFAAFAGASIGFVHAALTQPAARRFARGLITLTGVGCFVIAGEEISWGARVVGVVPPPIFLAHNVQQELNLHNLFASHTLVLVALALAFGLVFPLIARRVTALAPAAPPLALAPVFVVVATAALLRSATLSQEAIECVLGLAFAASIPGLTPRRRAIVVVGALISGALFAPILDRAVFGSDDTRIAAARAELGILAEELRRPRGISVLFESGVRVHHRLYPASQDGYVMLRGVDRYFIDPWGNPYWIFSLAEDGRVFIYSFGPDRRRGFDIFDPLGDAEDDVVHQVR